jgi:predicted O-methyltransferase YrrM
MSQAWREVDLYLAGKLLGDDPPLDAALRANEEAGLPAIDVSPVQGKLLHLLARASGARRILEIGTLGGYSTIWLARAVPEDGRVVTLEIDPHHAGVARANLDRAGVGARVDIRVGPALESLTALQAAGEAPFDFVFIDADKQNNANYVQAAIDMARPGALIIVDNVVREGEILDAASDDPKVQGTRRLFDMLADEPRLDATAVQTVGSKKWDGLVVALVRQPA